MCVRVSARAEIVHFTIEIIVESDDTDYIYLANCYVLVAIEIFAYTQLIASKMYICEIL